MMNCFEALRDGNFRLKQVNKCVWTTTSEQNSPSLMKYLPTAGRMLLSAVWRTLPAGGARDDVDRADAALMDVSGRGRRP